MKQPALELEIPKANVAYESGSERQGLMSQVNAAYESDQVNIVE